MNRQHGDRDFIGGLSLYHQGHHSFGREKAIPITMMEDTLLLQEMRGTHLNFHDLWQQLTQLLLMYSS